MQPAPAEQAGGGTRSNYGQNMTTTLFHGDGRPRDPSPISHTAPTENATARPRHGRSHETRAFYLAAGPERRMPPGSAQRVPAPGCPISGPSSATPVSSVELGRSRSNETPGFSTGRLAMICCRQVSWQGCVCLLPPVSSRRRWSSGPPTRWESTRRMPVERGKGSPSGVFPPPPLSRRERSRTLGLPPEKRMNAWLILVEGTNC